jgi:hypothetical protein
MFMRSNNIIFLQIIYFFTTALWPLVDIKSFEKITGPKTDEWLVKTVSFLILAIAIALFQSWRAKSYPPAIIALAVVSCLGLAAIDFYFSAAKIIDPVYALDGILQVVFVFNWVLVLKNRIR